MASGHLLLSCAKRAATTKIDLFAYLWQLPCALCSLILMTLPQMGGYQLRRTQHPRLPERGQNDGGRDHRESPENKSWQPVCVLLRRDGKPAPRIRSLLRSGNGALRPARADERRLCVPQKGHETADDTIDLHMALQENPQGE